VPELILTEDDYQPIRALNDLLFCERRCAMHRIEQVWIDNVHTVDGTHSHRVRLIRRIDPRGHSGENGKPA